MNKKDFEELVIRLDERMTNVEGSLSEIKDVLKDQCNQIKSLKGEQTKIAIEVKKFFLMELDERDDKIDKKIGEVSREVSGMKMKMVGAACFVGGLFGSMGSKLKEILGF